MRRRFCWDSRPCCSIDATRAADRSSLNSHGCQASHFRPQQVPRTGTDATSIRTYGHHMLLSLPSMDRGIARCPLWVACSANRCDCGCTAPTRRAAPRRPAAHSDHQAQLGRCVAQALLAFMPPPWTHPTANKYKCARSGGHDQRRGVVWELAAAGSPSHRTSPERKRGQHNQPGLLSPVREGAPLCAGVSFVRQLARGGEHRPRTVAAWPP